MPAPSNMVVTDQGLFFLLDHLRTTTMWTQLVVHLFENNYQPTNTSVIGDFVEPTWAGYQPYNLTAWSRPTLHNHVESTIAQPVWFILQAAGGPFNIYGIFVTWLNIVLWAQRDPAAPVIVQNAGDGYPFLPAFAIQSLFQAP